MHGDVDMILFPLHMTDWLGYLERRIFYFKIMVSDYKLRSFLYDDVKVVELTTNLRLLTEDLCGFVYADFKTVYADFTNPVWLANTTIITPTNEAAQSVNNFLLTKIPSKLKLYRISDTVDNETLYPIVFINKLTPSNVTNGTRYIIVSLHDHAIEAEATSGPYSGSTQLIPRNGIAIHIYTQTISCQANFCLDVRQGTGTDF
uniref:ATP-dependent DNA helicase n=1 Tax=Octopus bimaculoides TaxID=37653 RepID=A0A0L8H5P6_OCTBM